MDSSINIAVIDNYDSFTYNLVHLLEQLDVPLHVMRNDAINWQRIEQASHILIGPGPGVPTASGELMHLIQRYKKTKSILGVCLGMQALLEDEQVTMMNMPRVEHGMQDELEVKPGSKLFKDIGPKVKVGRYHSWAFSVESDLGGFASVATSSDGYVMAVEHHTLPLFGVQFHPESIMTENGLELVRNWLGLPTRYPPQA